MSDTTIPITPGAGLASPGVKLALIAGLALGLLIPCFLVGELIAEREERQEEVREEIGAAWGQPQLVLGPVLVLPYLHRGEGWERRSLAVQPASLATEVALAPERRRRGLFEAVVYTADISWRAQFGTAALLPEGAIPLWPEAHLAAAVSDLRGATPRLRWGDTALEPAADGVTRCGGFDIMRFPIGLAGLPAGAQEVSGGVALRGTSSLRALPLGPRNRLRMTAPWATPSFIGRDLPVQSSVTAAGFEAEWAGGQPLVGLSMDEACLRIPQAATGAGVALLEAVPTYRMVNRSAKYAAMFVALGFLTYLLIELLADIRIHIVQYGLLGASLVLFPLLLLAMAEPLGFAPAYGLTAAMVLGQASLHTAAVTGRWGLGSVFAGVLVALFGFLYVVLSLESFSLLVGAVALFAALSAVMLATRRVRWGA